MLKRTAIAAIAVCTALSSSAQSDSIYTKDLKKPVSITYIVRAIDTTPMTFSNITAEDIKKINYNLKFILYFKNNYLKIHSIFHELMSWKYKNTSRSIDKNAK